MKVVDYKAICVGDAEAFQNRIKEHLDKGWELYGSPMSPQTGWYFQAIILPEHDESDKDEVAYIEGKSVGEITLKVEERIEENWKTTGGLTVIQSEGVTLFYQTMTRKSRALSNSSHE